MKIYIILHKNQENDGWEASVIETVTGKAIYQLPSFNYYKTPEQAIQGVRDAGFEI